MSLGVKYAQCKLRKATCLKESDTGGVLSMGPFNSFSSFCKAYSCLRQPFNVSEHKIAPHNIYLQHWDVINQLKAKKIQIQKA